MPLETVVYQDSDLNTVIYPTSSDSTLSPHFTTDRGVLLPGEDSVVEIMEEEDVDEYRLPPCDIIPLCLGIYSAIRNPIYGVSPSDALWFKDPVILPSGSSPRRSIGYLPPSVDAALRRDEPKAWPEPLPRESDKGSALVKLRAIFEAIVYLNLTYGVLHRELFELIKVTSRAIGGTVLNAHFTAIEDPRFQMQIGLIKKWLRGRQGEFLRVLDEMGWLFEKSRDELSRMHTGRHYGGGLRERKVVRRRASDGC
ncbi:uncharacterized protein H6S33_008801 [Morchella sextelata]|uniref:uncharacterized protein n=1 Tax=Morchella sextelata TaxID=1174677 RepID=UPI001D03D3CF|nr:uncharacterized protein H6S33_008801 [Morchella sextelata]KAH0602462.1 hypothetical protein H6S33_008801 [Morchella sextelata]